MKIRLALGLAAAAVVAGGVFASAGGTASAVNCSAAAAREVVGRLRLGDPSVADPFGTVLCGTFTGPGSQAMVVVLRGPGNTGFADWVVFRWTGGAWQFLMKQPLGASITAAGSNIRQTLPIYRPADSRCCPTGGTKTRLWRWNGTRFTASAWKHKLPAAGAPAGASSGYFKTPSGNIVCFRTQALVICGIKSGLKPKPAYTPECSAAGLDHNADRIGLQATGRAKPAACSGDAGPFIGESTALVLGYGKTWSGGGLSCASAVSGLTCRNKSGRGFFLSRERWRAF